MVTSHCFSVSAIALLCCINVAAFTSGGPSFVRQSTQQQQHSRLVHYTAATSRIEFPGDGSNKNEPSSSTTGISSAELRHMAAVRRQRRLQDEQAQASSRFVQGDDLQKLRTEVYHLSQELRHARAVRDKSRVHELTQAIWQAQQVDAEYVYQASKERWVAALEAGRVEKAHEYRREAQRARNALPQFNLEGLWVGKYGEQGFEMINVTYAGDTLIAYKVTGDRVTKGQVSFSVDLSPDAVKSSEAAAAAPMPLEPIELAPDAAEQWGSQYLPRFAGQGQVASQGYVNSQWMEGQLILVNQYFSFAWLPIGHQVFFGRPSPELTLKLLRESRSKKTADDQVRDFLERCMEETELLDDEMEVDDSTLFTSHNQDDYYNQEGCWE